MDNKPSVSILVPTYNGEKYIRRFLESALNQKLESFEIICVDDMSTDNTLEILEEYSKEFPGKITVFTSNERHGFVGLGKSINTAFSHSRGDYIFICDQDDILHPLGLSTLYEEAIANDCDLIAGWAQELVIDDNGLPKATRTYFRKQTQAISNEAEIMHDPSFWLRLTKRSLMEKVGPFPEDCFFHDVAFLPVIKSFAKKIYHVNQIVYYYHRRTNSFSTSVKPEVAYGSIKSEKYALEHCNPKYLEAVQYFVAERTAFNIDHRWPFYDLFAKWAKEQMSWLDNNELVKNDKHIYNVLQSAAKTVGATVPNNIYVGGFESLPAEERISELSEKVFYDGCDIKILSRDNCDVDSNEYIKDAFSNGMTEFVTEYFALKDIYENGGFYIHNRVRILNYLSYLKNQNAVFFRLDNTTYSKYIFGAPPKNEVIEAIIKTYSYKWDKQKRFMPLDERIKVILTAKYDIPLNGKTIIFSNPVSIISMHNGAINVNWGKAFCEHDFSDFADNEEYITVKKSTLADMISVISTNSVNKSQADKNAAIVREYENMKRTNTYKLMMKIRKVGDSPVGPPLKKVFHGMLKLRKKLKKN